MSKSAPGTLPGLDTGDDGARSPDGASGGSGRPRIRKSAEAYRTISEVADDLHVPQHVLRFWETKFPRIRPLKRGGGRRYYRPDDVALLRRIADLLYIQGYTIKGVQRLLKEGGGALRDDIPPATGDERASADTGTADATIPPPSEQSGRDGLFADGPAHAESAIAAPPGQQRAPVAANAAGSDAAVPATLAAEIDRLHAALRGVLTALETLRRKLD